MYPIEKMKSGRVCLLTDHGWVDKLAIGYAIFGEPWSWEATWFDWFPSEILKQIKKHHSGK